MSVLRLSKIVSSLPTILTPDTIYLVRVGTGFELYCTDTTGNISYSLDSVDKLTDRVDILEDTVASILELDSDIATQHQWVSTTTNTVVAGSFLTLTDVLTDADKNVNGNPNNVPAATATISSNGTKNTLRLGYTGQRELVWLRVILSDFQGGGGTQGRDFAVELWRDVDVNGVMTPTMVTQEIISRQDTSYEGAGKNRTANFVSYTYGIDDPYHKANSGLYYRLNNQSASNCSFKLNVLVNRVFLKPKVVVNVTTTNMQQTFETLSKNLKAYPQTFKYTNNVLSSIEYLKNSDYVLKTFNYTQGLLTSIQLSGSSLASTLTKTFNYTDNVLTSTTYS